MKGMIQGGKELESLLKKFPERLQRDVTNAVVSRGATIIKKHMKKNIKGNGSDETGKLIKSIKSKKVRGRHGYQKIYTSWPDGAHSHLVEYGTASRVLKKPIPFEIEPGHWITLKKTGSAPAKPFFRPALDENIPEVMREMALRMAKRMATEATKMAGEFGTMKKSYRKKLLK